jgi:dihydropteroate synthase
VSTIHLVAPFHSRPDRQVEGLPQLPRCLVMGVLNVTPDSFSDGGRHLGLDAAVAHGLALHDEGADLVDVGGESTRPGAARVPEDEEQARVVPVVRALTEAGVAVSVDTMRASTAAAAVAAGAVLVNDVSGGLADPAMHHEVAGLRVPYVLMHWRAHSDTMQQRATYADVVADVSAELARQRDAAVDAGIDPARLALDPGIGFSKDHAQNWAVLSALDRFQALGHAVLVGTSRKRFLGELLAAPGPDGELRPPRERDDATTATTALAAALGAWCVRVHAVRSSADAVRVTSRWAQAQAAAGSLAGP